MKRVNQRGFTLVELLLATAVFSIALIAITAAIIQLFKAYQSGISIRKTQNESRILSEELTRHARASSIIAGSPTAVCFFYPATKNQANGEDTSDAKMYYVENEKLYRINKQVTYPTADPTCDSALFASGTTTQVSNEEIILKEFNGENSRDNMMELVMKIGTSNSVGEIEDISTDPDQPPDWECKPGYEYCSMTTIEKSIMARGEK